MKRVPLVWHVLRWPRDVRPEELAEAMRLLATTAGSPMILEAVGRPGAVEHRLAVPEGRHGNVAHQLRAALPGLRVDVTDHDDGPLGPQPAGGRQPDTAGRPGDDGDPAGQTLGQVDFGRRAPW